MRSICIILLAFSLCLGCSKKVKKQEGLSTDMIEVPLSNDKNASFSTPVLTFEKDMHDFGRMSQGENINYSFKFTNTGQSDLIISECKASCGCTVADFPKGFIKPKESGYITVSFNSSGKRGKQYQTVTVVSNAQPNTHQLSIQAEVDE